MLEIRHKFTVLSVWCREGKCAQMHLLKSKLHFAIAALCLIAAGVLAISGVKMLFSERARAVQVAATVKQPGIHLPIIMYHSMLPPSVMRGKYVVAPQLFEQDLQYLQKEGYTTVNIQDLINYVNGRGNLPAKPVMLSFDDGYYNNYKYAFPLVKKYNMKMVFAPIGICSEQFSKADSDHERYSHVTWKEMKEMTQSGLVEVQNHTYNLHHNAKDRLGASKKRTESAADYQKMLLSDLKHDQELIYSNTGVLMTAFVYPFGAISEASGPVIQSMGFQATMTCREKMNHITRNPQCLYGLGRFLRTPDTSPAQLFNQKINPSANKRVYD